MKPSLTVLVLVLLLLNILAGCARDLTTPKEWRLITTLRAFGLGSGRALLRRSCLWHHCSKATSVSTRSTTTELGTTLATCSALPASSVAAATGPPVGLNPDSEFLKNALTGRVNFGRKRTCPVNSTYRDLTLFRSSVIRHSLR